MSKKILPALLLLYFGLWLSPLAAQDKVSLRLSGVSIRTVLDSIESISATRIFYSSSFLPVEKRVDVDFSNRPLLQILNNLFPEPDVQILAVPGGISISKKQVKLFRVFGYVREKGSGENLIGVSIGDNSLRHTTQTNLYGFYSLLLPEGKNQLRITYVGYKSLQLNLEVSQSMENNFELENDASLEEVVIKDNDEKMSRGIQKIEVPLSQVSEVPAMLGETDVIKYLSLMPGVQKGTESNQGMFIRGGTPDQNLVIVDDATIYSAYHLFGINSLFSGTELRQAQLSKGGFSARYGGRTASVLSMSLKDGNRRNWEADAGVGILASHFQTNGPILKDKASMLISMRRTYIDLLARPFFDDDNRAGYYYYDIHAKVNVDLNSKNRLYLSAYMGDDKFNSISRDYESKDNASIRWGNRAFSLRHSLQAGKQYFITSTVYHTSYLSKIAFNSSDSFGSSGLEFNTGIQDYGWKIDQDFLPNNRHALKLGFGSILHQINPSALNTIKDQSGSSEQVIENRISATESFIYVEDTWRPNRNFELMLGLRANLFGVSNNLANTWEPRLQVNYQLSPSLHLNGSYTHMSQFLNLVSSGMMGLPIEIWIPSSAKLLPQQARQASLGYGLEIAKGWFLAQEFYYKRAFNVSAFREGRGFFSLVTNLVDLNLGMEFFERLLTQGQSESYGTEFSLKYVNPKIEAWFCYNLAKTSQQFNEVNLGHWFDAYYDRRHDLNLTAIWKPHPKWSFSAAWIFGSGFAMSVPEAYFYASSHAPVSKNGVLMAEEMNNSVRYYSQKNTFRTASFHRLDLGARFTLKKKKYTQIFSLSIYNTYNRANPFYYYVNSVGEARNQLVMASFFPILPSFAWRVLW